MKTINLTDEQANLLVCYILITTHHRENEQKAWAKLAEDHPDSPKADVYKSNADWYANTSRELEVIKRVIDEA